MNDSNVEVFVFLERKCFPLADLLKNQPLLQRSHAIQQLHRLRCNCRQSTAAGPELVIRQQKEAGYVIAKMPNTGGLHSKQCDFHVVRAEDSGAGEYAGAIDEKEDRTVIKVNFPLMKAAPRQALSTTTVKSVDTGHVKRASMGLHGLLSHLWNEARLNTWPSAFPFPWSKVWSAVTDVSRSIHLNKRPMQPYFYVQSDDTAWAQRLHSGALEEHYALVLFKVNRLDKAKYGGTWLVTNGARFLAKDPVFAMIERSDGRILHGMQRTGDADGGSKSATIICLALVERSGKGDAQYLSVARAAPMQVNWRFIPVESAYELAIADKLVAENRRFSKPLRYDADEDVVFPDFLLHDCGTHDVALEVYGMTGVPAYDQRKEEKRRHYRQLGLPFWEWTPADDAEIPAFPERG